MTFGQRVNNFLICMGLLIIIPEFSFLFNQRDFHQNELLYIVASAFATIFLFWCLKKRKIDKLDKMTKADWTQLAVMILILRLFSYSYSHMIDVHSASVSQIHGILSKGMTLSMATNLCIFGPILEEACCRGLMQKGAFDNSWFGVLLTSAIFSMLHVPNDQLSFLYFALVGLGLGFFYKKTDNLWVPFLCHMSMNGLIMFFS